MLPLTYSVRSPFMIKIYFMAVALKKKSGNTKSADIYFAVRQLRVLFPTPQPSRA